MKHFNSTIALLCAGLLSLFGAATVSAQTKLSGTVTDSDGQALAGVFVSVKGTQNATVTDGDGNFQLSAPEDAKELTFEMLGFKTAVEVIGTKALFSVMLEEDKTMLDETVVVGYGTMIRKELTSSVASVSSEDLVQRASAMNINQSMAGKMAGVQVRSTSGRPGDEGHVRVRGMGSINASSDPLYVVDGVVDVDPALVNYADVEKIDVLKDAAATAMYGAKGANGVVIITTKGGQKNSGTHVSFSTQTGVSVLARKLHMMNSEEYLQALNQAYLFSGKSVPDYLVNADERLFNYKMDGDNYAYDENGYLIASPKYDTDWQSVAYRPALLSTNNLTFTTGGEKTTAYANIGYQDNGGIYIGTYAKKFTGALNLKTEVTKWLDAQFSANFSRMNERRCPETWGLGWYNSGVENATLLAPIIPVQYPDGTYGSNSDFGFGNSLDNPVKIMSLYNDTMKTNNILLDGGLDFHIIEGLDLTVKGSYNVKNVAHNIFIGQGLKGSTDSENMAQINNTEVVRWSNEDYLTYNHTFADGKLKSNFVLGASWYYYNYETSTAQANSIPEELYQYHNLGSGTNQRPSSSGYDHNTMNSYYFRTNQVLLGRYMLGLTFRADGASNFGDNNKYGFFPSASAAWDIAAEPWFKTNDKVNQLKLRLSYGSVGNASIGSYKTFSQYSSGTIYMDGVSNAYVKFANLANKDLSWETIKQFDAGLDMGFFKDRINIVADFYIKNSYDLLFNKTIPYTTGYDSSTMNIGQLRNTGFEFTLNAHAIDKRDFKWDIDFIFSTNKCIAVDLVDNPFTNGSNSACRVYQGEEYCSWYVFHRLGTWGTDEIEEAAKYGQHPGDPKYEDRNGDGQLTYDDRYQYGSMLPKFEGSLVNTFYFKGFTASIDFGGMGGYYMFNHQAAQMECNFGANNTTVANLNAWTPQNQNTMIPALRTNSDENCGTYYGVEIDDWWVEKADYIRLRNISLSYDFGDRVLRNSKVINGLILGVNVENAYLFTNYSGYDPEMGSGYDLNPAVIGSYPKPMVITGNLKITF